MRARREGAWPFSWMRCRLQRPKCSEDFGAPCMSDDYLDRIAALLPNDALERYLQLKNLISSGRHEIWRLQEELIEIARAYGIPDIDDPNSESNKRICTSLQAVAPEINSVWASVPGEWICPCCRRSKLDCARLGAGGQMLGKLVAHHDHFEDLMDVVLSRLSKDLRIEVASSIDAQQFIRRGAELFRRFDRIIVCEDCNNAEAKGKLLSGADRYFTFTPRELSAFVLAAPNRPHEVDDAALAKTYTSAKRHYDLRAASIRKLAEHALIGTAWYEPVASEYKGGAGRPRDATCSPVVRDR